MSENNEQPAKKTDWSFVESVRAAENPGGVSRAVIRTPYSAEIVPVDGSNVPSAPVVSLPDSKPGLGILAQWRANTISRKSALQELQATYDAQLDILKHRLEKAVTMKNAQADVIATEYLKQLDAQQLDILTKLDLKNKATRERALFDLTEMTAARLREVQNTDWPPELKADTVGQLFLLRTRYVAEMMKELGT